MSSEEHHMRIARKVRSIEKMKVELAAEVVEVLRTTQTGTEREIVAALANVIGISHVIACQLGIPLPRVTNEVVAELLAMTHTHSDERPELDAVLRYLGSER